MPYGPTTSRLIDSANLPYSLTISRVGLCGVPFDRYYGDQTRSHIEGDYSISYLDEEQI